MMRFPALSACAALLLTGCTSTLAPPDVGRLVEPDITLTSSDGPPNSAPGTCWGKETRPAQIETVTEQILVQPAQIDVTGAVLEPAMFRTETQQRIVRERQEIWFETPCPADLTIPFVQTLQRALTVRGFYRGSLSGEMDSRTRAAVRRYQQSEGLDSGILSMAAARKLGLVAYEVTTDG